MNRLLRAGLAVLSGAAIASCAGQSSPSGVSALPAVAHRSASGSPIKHVIVVIQENRSFDDLFATFPNADGTTKGQAEPMPSQIATTCKNDGMPVITQSNTTVPLTKVSLLGAGFPHNFGEGDDLPHVYEYKQGGVTYTPFLTDYDDGNMDGFDLEGSGPNGTGTPLCTYPYQYVDPNDITEYWDLAQDYVLADHMFQTQGSGTFTAHQDLIAGGTVVDYAYGGYSRDSVIDNPTYFPWGCDALKTTVTSLIATDLHYLFEKGPRPCFTYKTMRDLLDAKKVSWKYYAVAVQKPPHGDTPGIWSAFDAIKAVRYGPEWGKNVPNNNLLIFNDLKNGDLPAVSWITPDAQNSDHPQETNLKGKLVDNGPSWVAAIVNAVGKSRYWNSSAVIVLWDDWGGFYDQESPAFLRDDQGGLGFRVPMLIVSPYVTAHVEHTQYEFGSILKFIEDNWGLGSLRTSDERATSIGNAFDFNQSPRRFKVIPAKLPLSFFLHQKPSGIIPDSE